MRANLARWTWLVVAFAAILLLVGMPGTAIASVEMATESCDPNPCQENLSLPACCVDSGCALSYCLAPDTTTKEALLPGRLTPNGGACLSRSPMSLALEPSPNRAGPVPRDFNKELPSDLFTAYHCRNSLSSEEPATL